MSEVSFLPTASASGSAIALYARASVGFDERVAHALELLRNAAAEHPERVVQATSLGAEDMVITCLLYTSDAADE